MLTIGLLAAASAVVLAVGIASQSGLPLYLPFPADGFLVEHVHSDFLPLSPSPLEGRFTPEPLLKRAVKILEGQVHGSESVVVHPDGSLILLDKFGFVRKAVESSEFGGGGGTVQYELHPEPLAHLGPGRPLGAALDANLNLIVCDSLKGLLKVDLTSGQVTILTSRVSATSPLHPSSPIVYANDLDIASDGSIYFTDSQRIPVAVNALGFWDTLRSYILGLLSGSAQGRLLKYNPSTGQTTVLEDGFWYANGVALSADESFVAVVETNRIRVNRHWIKGPKAGTTDVLIDSLPAFPDGVDRSEDGGLWVSCVAPVLPVLKLPVVKYPVVRALVAWLPQHLKPKPVKMGLVIKVSEQGDVQRVLGDIDGSHVAYVSAAHSHGGNLFLGNLVQDYVSYVPAVLLSPEGLGGEASVTRTAAE